MASLLIGITGKKRHGKDTFASRLVEAHGFTRLAFADALKASALIADPILEVEAVPNFIGGGYSARYIRLSDAVREIGWEAAKEIAEVRRFLQNYGVGMRKHVHAEVWVDAVRLKAEAIDGPVVVTDVRFPNEFSWATRAGTTVRVFNPRVPSDDEHVSETALDGFSADWTVVNDGTVADLHAQADTVLDLVRRRVGR